MREAIMGEWTLFSNHGHVLVCLARNNQARLRDVAADVGITERAVQNILRELQDAGLVAISKHGRCNHYQINSRKSLRHPLESSCTVGKLMQLINQDEASIAQTDAESHKPKATKPGVIKSSKPEPVSMQVPAGDSVKAVIPDTPKAATIRETPVVVAAPDKTLVESEVRPPLPAVEEKAVIEEKAPVTVANPPKPEVAVVASKKLQAEVKPEKQEAVDHQFAKKDKADEPLNAADEKPKTSKSVSKKTKEKIPSTQQGSLF